MRELAPGAMVAGYRIDSLIGRGGMGVAYRAFQTGLAQPRKVGSPREREGAR